MHLRMMLYIAFVICPFVSTFCNDEVGHVATGSYWFNYFCTARGWEAERTFYRLLTKHFKGRFESLNIEARLAAGFSLSELENLLKLGRN